VRVNQAEGQSVACRALAALPISTSCSPSTSSFRKSQAARTCASLIISLRVAIQYDRVSCTFAAHAIEIAQFFRKEQVIDIREDIRPAFIERWQSLRQEIAAHSFGAADPYPGRKSHSTALTEERAPAEARAVDAAIAAGWQPVHWPACRMR
jgi:hypothetical protein